MTSIAIHPIKSVKQTRTLTNEQMLSVNRTDKQILSAMDENTYEELVASWAYMCLKPKYEDVYQIGGAGDHGIDVLAYTSLSKKECDIYQCKHYQNSVTATIVFPEICKILYFAFLNEIPVPKNYFIVAPKGLSTSLLKWFVKPKSIKSEVKNNWNKYSKNITSKGSIALSPELETFIDGIDFHKFSFISQDNFICRIRENKHLYHQYFGFRKSDIERVNIDAPTRATIEESTYISHLLSAYNEIGPPTSLENIGTSKYAVHYARARKTFWITESLRKISEDNSPGETDEFAEFMDDMELHVADVYEDDYENGLERNKKVISEAKKYTPKRARIISDEISSGEKMGVCYHLSNNNRLIWVK